MSTASEIQIILYEPRFAQAQAQVLGATQIYLESNTVLEPAIRLYRRLGFLEITGPATPYARCNIQMLLKFKNQK